MAHNSELFECSTLLCASTCYFSFLCIYKKKKIELNEKQRSLKEAA